MTPKPTTDAPTPKLAGAEPVINVFAATIEQPKPSGGLFAGIKPGEKETPAGPELAKKPSLFEQKPPTSASGTGNSLFTMPAGAGGGLF